MLQELTIAQLVKRTCSQVPDRIALFDNDESLTYKELDELTDKLASGLYNEGIRPQNLVGIFSYTSVKGLIYYYALQKLNARVIFLPEKVHENELANYTDVEGLDAICIDKGHCEIFGENEKIKSMTHQFMAEYELSGDREGINELCRKGQGVDIEKIIAEGSCYDTAVMLFTSGTTGRPKIVMTSGYSRVNGGIQQAYDQHFTEEDVVMEALPMHHCFALSVNIMSAMAAGAALFIPKDRHSATILEGLHDHKCTVLSAVPALYNAIVKNPKFKEYEIRLRTGIIGGGRYTPKMFKEIERDFAPTFTLLSSLGMTEGTAGVTVCEMDDPIDLRAESIGHFMAYVEGKILDPATGKECEYGKQGEICFRGYNVMQGYYKNPEATAQAIDENGYLHSGDLGHMEADGTVYISGRLKEIIIRGGDNISPVEVENAIYEDPRVTDCKVVGVPDEHYGEQVYACVVTNAPMTADEVKAAAANRLIKSKVPYGVVFLDELPLNGNNKVDTAECRRIAKEEAEKQ